MTVPNLQGWQKQPDGKAVQDHINAALEEVFHHPVKTVGAGRTDAGVHAKGQVFHFDKNWEHGEESMVKAFRSHLPRGISPRKIRKVGPRFHAHLSARGKQYRYRAVKGWAMPQDERFVLSLKKQIISTSVMEQAAQFFLGEHDFSAFPRREEKMLMKTLLNMYGRLISRLEGITSNLLSKEVVFFIR